MAGESVGDYLPAATRETLLDSIDRGALIERYFKLGLTYEEINVCLYERHGVRLSLRHLKHLLKGMHLGRKGAQRESSLNQIFTAIREELLRSGANIGYRAMWQRLRCERALVVSREVVRLALRIIDPDGVEERRKHRLQRRKYRSWGPNQLWHIDGYDKLKPYGFCIHGCIDGFSRRIMWLKVATSNNNPAAIAKYFLDCVRLTGGTPRVVRADKGTENGRVAGIQRFLRRDDLDENASDKSFIYGKSVSNQRIEAWWSILRKGCTGWWIEHFKDIKENGLYSECNIIHQECLKFCYIKLLQDELHRIMVLWNTHKIRPQRNADVPSGRPDMMFMVPDLFNAVDGKVQVELEDLEVAEELCCDGQPIFPCNPGFSRLAHIIMEEERLAMPNTPSDAKQLYIRITNHIEAMT
eukprot:gene15232-biopygen12685